MDEGGGDVEVLRFVLCAVAASPPLSAVWLCAKSRLLPCCGPGGKLLLSQGLRNCYKVPVRLVLELWVEAQASRAQRRRNAPRETASPASASTDLCTIS